MEEENQASPRRDIRRYYCHFCGICRSKRALITSHMVADHKEEMEEEKVDGDSEPDVQSNTCEECGATFDRPSHLKQHMRSHSNEREALDPTERTPKCVRLDFLTLVDQYQDGRPPEKLHQISLSHAIVQFERPFVCPVNGCNASYKRKDHLYVHLQQHQGKLYVCPIDGCNQEFAHQSNMKMHVKQMHGKDSSSNIRSEKKHFCLEEGCGKVFEYASKLKKHANSHVKLDSVEAFCSEPTCMKYFTNEECLRAHVRSCHRYITCEVCGAKQLRKNIRRHLRTHESRVSSKRIKCDFKGCVHTFATKSNLHQHVKAVHYGIKPFACSVTGCGQRFSFKHVRDGHEKSICHVFAPGDFVESDEQHLWRPRGGRKRACPTVEMLLRKRVTPPDMDSMSEEV